MNEDIKVSFVIRKDCKNETECTEEMQLAFVTCEQHRGGGLQPRWVKETDISKFEGLTKRDVFVLNEFAGEIFDKLRTTKCLLIGPRCLSCCLTEGTPIPSGREPVFTVAMRGLVVTASGLTKQKKESIKRKVHWMGGVYNSALTDDTTHLVSDTVLSDKYVKAVEKDIPVMSESWVEAVWEASLRLNINGASSEFNEHRLPPFTNLQVTTSGLSKKDKQTIMKLVQEKGGTFSGSFQSETTDVVVLTKEGIGSEKYKAAFEYNKACVLPAWVKDSAQMGVALPLARYRVAGASTSSPLAEHRVPDISLNFSRITNLRPPSSYVDETRSVDISTMSSRMKLTQETRKSSDGVDQDVQTAFENFDVGTIKKAGPIFDGFCIWVAGPEGTWRERACACVSRGGGVRYDAPHDRVTHIVAASASAAASATSHLPAVPVLSPLWLLQSVAAGKALNEIEYLIDAKPASPKPASVRKPRIEPASPMSKRNLQLLQLAPPSPKTKIPVELESPGDDIVDQYLSQNMPSEPVREKTPERVAPDVTSRPDDLTSRRDDITDDIDEPTEEVEQIFRGIKIEVQGLDEEAICEIGAEVSAAGGCLVAAGAGGAYAIVPLDFDPEELVTRDATPVTVFWVKDCLSQQELVPVQYQHRPVKLPEWSEAPLKGVVASLSTYSGVERAFLDELAKLLGATTQLRFCRRTTANALASTHLLCPTPCGDKYLGAVKWGLPAVKGEWLLKCAETGRREPEGPYLVGDTKAPEPLPSNEANITADQSTEPPDQHPDNKENAMRPPLPGTTAPRRGSASSREHTPKGKPQADAEADMSPASRYIAMARQGLLGCDTQDTPKRVHDLINDANEGGDLRTPNLEDALSTPNLRGLSPTTRRRLQAVKRGEMPSDPIRTPTDPFEKKRIETPDSAFGAALRPGSGRLSPDARKRLWQFVDGLPSKESLPVKEKLQTPLSEIRNRFLAQFNGEAPTPPSEHVAVPRKLCLQAHEESPASKIAKTSANQSPGAAAMPQTSHHTVQAECSAKSAEGSKSSLPAAVDAQLQRLSAALSRNSSPAQRQRRLSVKPSLPDPESEPGPESQPNTVGWDDATPNSSSPPRLQSPPVKRFMLSSNVDNREELIAMIQYLHGEVSDGTELDPTATHLLCAAPGRSEKMLGSVAHGKWVLHPAYVTRSRTSGTFVDEEDYEWGNPRATCLPSLSASEQTLAKAAYRWRLARANDQSGPFHGVTALLHVPAARKRLLAKLVTAGGGIAITDDPPYNNTEVTVCFADIKRFPLSDRDAAWLKSRRIPVCAPVVLSSYLTDETRPDPWDHCLHDYKH